MKSNRDPTETNPDEANVSVAPGPSRLERIVKEAPLHFVLTGAAIYLLFGEPGEEDAIANGNTIVVAEGEISWLTEMWTEKWNRPPSEAEMLGMVRDQLRETLLYREAVAMGLDKNDVIIRRRMA